MTRSLSTDQQRAASLIGAGHSRKDVGREVGVTTRTLGRWNDRADFRVLVQRQREAAVDKVPTAKATLEAALNATTASGAPDWRTRVSAARALVGLDGPGEGTARETTIYVENLDDGNPA